MNYQMVSGPIKNTEDQKELAKAIWDFYLWQYETALRDEIELRSELEAYKSANRAASDEYRRNNELGWGPPEHYSSIVIENKKIDAENAKQNLHEAKALLNFVRDRFLDKWL